MPARSWSETVKNYVENSSINGHKYLMTGGKRRERCIWCVFNLGLLLIASYLVLYTWERFSEAPTATWKISSRRLVDFDQFPKVAICEMNKISRKSAVRLATTLSNLSGGSMMTFDEILTNLSLLGRLYDYSFNSGEESKLVRFQSFLESHLPQIDLVRTLLIDLSIPCSNIVTDCHWNGLKVDCRRLFSNQMTSEGLCCVLNNHEVTNYPLTKKLTANLSGRSAAGLTVTVLTNEDDYFYGSLAMIGTKVMIYHTESTFPDANSGGVTEKLLSTGYRLTLLITTEVLVTTDEVKKYPIATRNCLFRDEHVPEFGRCYDRNNCVMDCKLKSIAALCQCIPFQYQNGTDYPSCNLADITCLSKYKSKWTTVFPKNNFGERLARERQDSLHCPQCLAPCADNIYTITQDGYRIRENFSQLEVNFGNPFCGIFMRDALFYWYDMIGIFGGLCSLVMGASFISAIEVLYYFSIKHLIP